MVHVEPDYKVREYALGWYQKGVLKEENLQTVDTKLAEPVPGPIADPDPGETADTSEATEDQTDATNTRDESSADDDVSTADQKQSRNNFIAGIRKHLPWKVLF